MSKVYLVGSDIECFLTKEGKFVSSIGRIGGSKADPLATGRRGCFLQEDNVAAEFNVNPTRDPSEMWDDIVFNMDLLRDMTATEPLMVPSANFPEEELDHPKAREFGCDPDYNAWLDGYVNEAPDSSSNATLRSCGGHIHIGRTDIAENPDQAIELIKLLDFYLGVGSILLDNDTKRRKLYGKAGSYRMKDYGVEYRTLSNFWASRKVLVEWVFANIEKAMTDFDNKITLKSIFEKDGKGFTETYVRNVIDNGDFEGAKQLDKMFNLVTVKTLETAPVTF